MTKHEKSKDTWKSQTNLTHIILHKRSQVSNNTHSWIPFIEEFWKGTLIYGVRSQDRLWCGSGYSVCLAWHPGYSPQHCNKKGEGGRWVTWEEGWERLLGCWVDGFTLWKVTELCIILCTLYMYHNSALNWLINKLHLNMKQGKFMSHAKYLNFVPWDMRSCWRFCIRKAGGSSLHCTWKALEWRWRWRSARRLLQPQGRKETCMCSATELHPHSCDVP